MVDWRWGGQPYQFGLLLISRKLITKMRWQNTGPGFSFYTFLRPLITDNEWLFLFGSHPLYIPPPWVTQTTCNITSPLFFFCVGKLKKNNENKKKCRTHEKRQAWLHPSLLRSKRPGSSYRTEEPSVTDAVVNNELQSIHTARGRFISERPRHKRDLCSDKLKVLRKKWHSKLKSGKNYTRGGLNAAQCFAYHRPFFFFKAVMKSKLCHKNWKTISRCLSEGPLLDRSLKYHEISQTHPPSDSGY